MKINTSKVSDTPWGDVDKSALGQKLATAYAQGDVTKDQIREVYAAVPDSAFTTDADGKPKFLPSKAWGPHHEIINGEIVLNRSGLGAAAAALSGARAEPALTPAEKTIARSHLRRHYNALKLDLPGSLKETQVIQKGKPLTELVKGSLEYTKNEISDDFREQFSAADPNMGGMMMCTYYIVDTFADYIVVSEMGDGELAPDEYYKVTYTQNADGDYVFAPQDQWETVELAYQPAQSSENSDQSPVNSDQSMGAMSMQDMPMGENRGKKKGKKFEERIDAHVLLEAREEGKPRKIKIEGAITADIVNGNGRRYPSSVIGSAVAELRNHLNESAGQGRAIQILGEAEHPSDKGGRPNLLETVTKWDEVLFDGKRVDLTGRILETSKGKDILTLMEGGVMPGVSLRGYGEGKTVGKGDDKVFEVTELHLTGFDLVLEPSFENVAQLVESQSHNQSSMEDDMSEELLNKLQKQEQEKAELNRQLEEAKKQIAEADEIKKQIEETKRAEEIKAAIAEATKDLPFGKAFNEMFVESMNEQEFTTVDAVKKFAESQRKQYAKMAAKGVLKGMGYVEGKGLQVLGDVLENETGTPAFARAAFEITETVRKRENRAKRTMVIRAESPAQVFTEKYLALYDQKYGRQLVEEARRFEEAELTTDLNLPYSVSRAIIEEAFPNLVAANVFDFGIMTQSPENIFFEAFTGETGYSVDITDEVVTMGAEETWYALAHANLVPGTVVVTSNPAGTTWVEGTDYVIDYQLGKIKGLTAGGINTDDVLVDYTYHATRQGENAEIERAKVTLSYQILTASAMRIADYISSEAIMFSRSQLGWDAVGRTIFNLIRQVRRDIDRGLIEKALASALGVANNSGGTWTNATDPFSQLAETLGYTKVKVANRFYDPTSFLMSKTNSDLLSNWDGFTRLGFPNALLNAAGFAGGIKGLPVFDSTEMRDGWNLCINKEIVMHRVYSPMIVKGPFPIYSNGKLIAGEQYYAEEYNGSIAPLPGKAAYMVMA